VDAAGSLFATGDLACFSAFEDEAPATVALDSETVAMGALETLSSLLKLLHVLSFQSH
jgi:hypothetical protein